MCIRDSYTWFIFLMTALVIFWSQFALGSRDSLFVFGWFVVVNLTIFCLSLTRGRGVGGLDWPHSIALIVALASITLWFMMRSVLMALICILVADTIAITPVSYTHLDVYKRQVDGGANQAKGDGDAATWLPANKAFRCQYIARQIAVKAKYNLWVTPPEKAAMQQVLGNCPTQTLPTQ